MTFRLTQRQELQSQMIASDATHIMAYWRLALGRLVPRTTRMTIAPPLTWPRRASLQLAQPLLRQEARAERDDRILDHLAHSQALSA